MLLRTCTFQRYCIVVVANIFGESTAKRYTIHCPIINTVTLLYIQQHPSVLETAIIAKSWHAAAGLWSFAVLRNLTKVALQKRQRTEFKNTCNCSIVDTFECYLWKLITPKASNRRAPKLGLEVRRVCSID